MEFDDVVHFGRIISGCESISSRLNGGPNLTADGHYAYAVLKLHAFDEGVHAGQEGFLDSIKKGAKNSVKWVKELMTSILNWIKNTFLKLIGKGENRKVDVSKEVGTQVLVPALEKALEKLKDIKQFDVAPVISEVEKYVVAANKGGDITSHNEKVVSNIRSVTATIEKKITSLKEGSEEDNQVAAKLGIDLKKLAEASMVIYLGTNKALAGGKWEPGESLVKSVGVSRSRARSAIMNEIDDPRLSIDDVKKSIKYVESKYPDLYEPYEDNTLTKKINTDQKTWTADTFNQASSSTNSNFSKERLSNMVAIAKYLNDTGVKGFKRIS